MNDYVLLYVTCPDRDVARGIGRELVDKRLAACVNVHGGHTAIYRWDGAVQEGEEVAMTVKTRASLIGQVNQLIRAEHPDEVPCVISLPIQGGNPDFLSWIIRETQDSDDDFSLDHLVLTVADIDATCDFYTRALGMTVQTFGAGRVALRFGEQKINLHPIENDIDIKAARPTPGSADLCFITSLPIGEAEARLRAAGVVIEFGPSQRTGATGPIMSVYFRDPDDNLIEVSEKLDR